MKKIFIAASLFLTMSAFATPTAINEKVLTAFNQVFKNVQEVVWLEEDGNFRVNFKQDEVTVKIVYDADGNMLESLRYYNEAQLPMLIRAKLKKEFSGKKVFGVTEYVSGTNMTYHITLEDEKSWTMVTSDGSANLQVTKKFKKA
ncbi:MAG TPA: hypothetical protein VM888_14195 [Chitinophagaceae bacterium]|jgi:hypothetical protein|nr:hypothetical protein [Chitinophagaceae bacterium]